MTVTFKNELLSNRDSKYDLIKPVILIAGFLVGSCSATYHVSDMKGHWSVEEEGVGYLEFKVSTDSMVVCSPRYGQLYKGKIKVENNQLIQFVEGSADSVRLTGDIVSIDETSMVLKYDDTIEECIRIGNDTSMSLTPPCFSGSNNRMKK